MRRSSLAALLALLAWAAASPAHAQPGTSAARCASTWRGHQLVGTLRDAETGKPLPGIVEIPKQPVLLADTVGCFAEYPWHEFAPGRPLRLRANVHRYVPVDTVIHPREGGADTVHFALRPAAPPCCRLDGEWNVRLVMESTGTGLKRRRARQVAGAFVFSDSMPDRGAPFRAGPEERGRFDVDLSVFFGGPYAPDVSTSFFGGAADFLTEVTGEVFAGDSVEMVMIPGMSHGGLSLHGRIAGDSAAGRWYQNAYAAGSSGRFVMHRRPRGALTDSLVARARRAAEAARVRADSTRAAGRARAGYVRLRLLDTSTGRHVAADFRVEGEYQIFGLRSGDGGWGEWDEVEPGTYEAVLASYSCRGVEYWPDEEAGGEALKTRFTVRTGERVERELRIDLSRVKPMPTEDNLAASPCGAAARP